MDYVQRREAVLQQFTQGKSDLENLNKEIEAEAADIDRQIAELTQKFQNLNDLKEDNNKSIKAFSKFLK